MLDWNYEYLKLNKSILVSIAASVTVSAVFAQAIAGQADHLNTTYTLLVDHAVYFTVFGILYYRANRQRYLGAGRAGLRRDLLKIVTSLGVSEVVYTVVRWLLQYYLLTIQYDPYLASVTSQGISIGVYLAMINLSVKLTRLYRNDN